MTAHTIPALTVLYGTVLDLTFAVGNQRVLVAEWRGWQLLVGQRAMDTAPGRARIYLVRGAITRRAALGPELDQALEQYERWHRREAESVGQLDGIPAVIGHRQGRVLRLGYRSDKWGPRRKHVDYDHDFTENAHRPPWLYTNTRTIERARAAVIVGGDMSVTEEGID